MNLERNDGFLFAEKMQELGIILENKTLLENVIYGAAQLESKEQRDWTQKGAFREQFAMKCKQMGYNFKENS